MKNQQLILLTLSCLLAFQVQSKAQVILGTTGGELTGNTGKISYSVGQYLSEVRLGDMTTLQLGVQQAYEVSIVTGVDEALVSLKPTIFPNPSPDVVYLKFNPDQRQSYHYQILDMQGRVLKKERLLTTINPIDLTAYSTQVLLIRINDQKRTLKTFKIVKQ